MPDRSDESPMDFSWDNGNGPIDVNSPFITAIRRPANSAISGNGPPHPKRSRSEFESPAKSQSSFPSLRAPVGQTTLFSNLPRPVSPNKPLPATPNLEAFKTPRKFDTEFFSSGGETPNTPDTVDADSEATPDIKPFIRSSSPTKNINMGFLSSRANGSSSVAVIEEKRRAPSPKKKRESWITRLVSSPGRREALTSALKPYSTKAEKRVNKRRARAKIHSKSSVDLTGDSDSDSNGSGNKKDKKKQATGFYDALASYLRLVEDHPNAPTILITYLQLLSNFLLICFSIYVVSSLWSGILGDVDKGVRETQSEAMLEVLACKQDWVSFRCEDRPERTRDLCETLAKCIAKDPEKIARAQVSAKTFAKIINDFAEPISLKAMVFYLSIFAIFWYSTNATWNGLRNKLAQEYLNQQHHQMPPATPARHPSNGIMYPNTPYTASHHGFMYSHGPAGFIPGMEPGPSGFPLANGALPGSFTDINSSQEGVTTGNGSPKKQIEFG